jgi:hypothetical protein
MRLQQEQRERAAETAAMRAEMEKASGEFGSSLHSLS